MRIQYHTKQFRRDYKKMKRSHANYINELHIVMDQLIDGKILQPQYRDHMLHGEWKNCRDCHIKGDWVLIYELGTNNLGEETIIFHETDNHGNLFG